MTTAPPAPALGDNNTATANGDNSHAYAAAATTTPPPPPATTAPPPPPSGNNNTATASTDECTAEAPAATGRPAPARSAHADTLRSVRERANGGGRDATQAPRPPLRPARSLPDRSGVRSMGRQSRCRHRPRPLRRRDRNQRKSSRSATSARTDGQPAGLRRAPAAHRQPRGPVRPASSSPDRYSCSTLSARLTRRRGGNSMTARPGGG